LTLGKPIVLGWFCKKKRPAAARCDALNLVTGVVCRVEKEGKLGCHWQGADEPRILPMAGHGRVALPSAAMCRAATAVEVPRPA